MDALYTETIITEKYGYSMTINLYQDPDAPNPFEEFDTLGTLESTFPNAFDILTRNAPSLWKARHGVLITSYTPHANAYGTITTSSASQRRFWQRHLIASWRNVPSMKTG